MGKYNSRFTFSSCRKVILLFFLIIATIIIQSIFLTFLSSPEDRNQNLDYTRYYEPVAENIMEGKGVVDDNGNVATYWPPGFPLILSQIFRLAEHLDVNRLELIMLFNVVVTAINCLLIFFIGEQIFNERIGFLGALIWITYPFNLWLLKQPNSELPFMFLYFLSVFLFIYALNKNRLWVVYFVGVILALSALIRPISIMLIGVFILMILIYRGVKSSLRFVSVFLIIAGFLITAAPWEYYVYSKTGEIVPLSKNGPDSIKGGLQFAIIYSKPSGELLVTPGDAMELMNRDNIEQQFKVPDDVLDFMIQTKNMEGQLKNTADVFNYVIQEFKENPKTMMKLYIIKAVRSWYATTRMWYESYILPIQIFYLVLGVTGIICAFKQYNEKKFFVLFFIAMIFYFWAITVMVVSVLRFMIPPMGLVLIFAAIPIDRLLSRLAFYRNHVVRAFP